MNYVQIFVILFLVRILNLNFNNSQDGMGVHFGGQLTVTYRTVTTNNDEF